MCRMASPEAAEPMRCCPFEVGSCERNRGNVMRPVIMRGGAAGRKIAMATKM